ncbi:DUF4344 domain-containing metallopeptidase [Pelagibacterium sediminicola]|uniref:DUF4344 domain-containing metallopeptidase n=1 Tax=Pelagibacterium sediminicola TaxID=2248761 RepID=UPI000E31D20A|nr:DUF4344 domain-containing metallopeptidase [Pelagibacterium sediminicola]
MKNTVLKFLGLFLAVGAIAFAPMSAQAVEQSPEDRAEVDEFVLGAATAIMLHEVGHLIINELEIPILAREEDAADTIATLILLIQDEEDDERAARYLQAFVTNWFLFGLDEYGAIDDAYMADEHSLNRQRAFAAVCLAHGSGHPSFTEHAERHGLSQERMARCESEFESAMRSFAQLLTPHFLDDGAAQIGKPIILYDETETYAGLRERLEALDFLEELAELVFDEIAMPRDVIFGTGECGFPNAFYTPTFLDGNPAVIFCYEMAEMLDEGYIDAFFSESAYEPSTPFENLVEENEVDDAAAATR